MQVIVVNQNVKNHHGISIMDHNVEHQTQQTDDVRLFVGIFDTYTRCNNNTNIT